MTHDQRLNEIVEQFRRGRMSRRAVLRRGAALGLSIPAITAVIGSARPTAYAASKKKLRLATWVGADEGKELQGVIDKVNAAADDFEIVSEPTPNDYYTKLQTTIAGGTAADMFWLSQEYIAGYADKGALLDVSDRLKADQSPAAQLDDYFPAVLQTAQFNGKTYGLPWIAQPVVMYYNPDLFQAAGVSEPDESWDWTTFKEAATKLTDKAKGVYGTTFSGWPPLQMFVWQAGGEVITADLKSCPIDSEEAVQGA